MISWTPKDPDERLDYHHDWSPRFTPVPGEAEDPADEIAVLTGTPGQEATTKSPYAIIESGDAVIDALISDDNRTTVWLKGGTDATEVIVLQRIHTTKGRVFDERFKLKVKTR